MRMTQIKSRGAVVFAMAALLVSGAAATLGATNASASSGYYSPVYGTLSRCNNARPTHSSSFTRPGQCKPVFKHTAGGQLYTSGYRFFVSVRTY